jgi:hypothetical protein
MVTHDACAVITRESLNQLALEELIGVKNINFEYVRNTTSNCVWDEILLLDDYEKPPKEEFEAKLQELIDAQPWKELRQERNKRLTECDWVATKAFTTGTPVPDEWKAYMQALRDLPANTTDPENPVWPEAPN